MLYSDLTARVALSLSLFEQLCKSAVFSVPAQALLPVVSGRKEGCMCAQFICAHKLLKAGSCSWGRSCSQLRTQQLTD